MLKLLVIGLGGFVGAIARYVLSGLVHRQFNSSFPAGTLLVNVLGCLAMGGLMALVEDRQLLTPAARMFLMVGLLGSLTTFSTFGYETMELMRDGNWPATFANVTANVALGMAAVWLGRASVRFF
jgi:CrcB protein